MNETNLRELAIKIIGIIDYDMKKAATLYEVEEWKTTVKEIENVLENVLIDAFNDGYSYCEADYSLGDR